MIYLAKDLTDANIAKVTNRNITVKLKRNYNLPFIHKSQLLGSKENTTSVNTTPEAIEYNCALKSKYASAPTLADFKNGLYEAMSETDTSNRFVPITITPNDTQISSLCLYYDKKEQAYLLAPNLDDLTNDSDENMLKGREIELEVYYVGITTNGPTIERASNLYNYDLAYTQSIDNLTDCKIHMCIDNNIDGIQKKQNIGEMINDKNDYLEFMGINTYYIISLGNGEHLQNSELKMPTFVYAQTGITRKSFIPAGNISVPDIAIFLPL
jgi:hypothetical protein